MRFLLGPPPSPEAKIGSSWTALREPGPWVMQALATPIGVALAVAVLVAWGRYAPKPAIAFEDWFKVAVVLALLLAQVPASATVRNQGYRTYWRHATPGET